MGETAWGGNWVLFWWVGPCSVHLSSNFLLMGGAVFPPCCLTWGQTMVEVMKITGTSFKKSWACAATLSAPDPTAGHHWPTPPPETPGHSQANVGQFLVGSLLLSPGSWCTQGFICALQEPVSPVLCKSQWFYGGVNGDLLQEGLCHTQAHCTQSPCSRTPVPPQETLRHSSSSVSVGWACVLCPSRSEQLRQPGAWWTHCPRWAMRLNHLPGPGRSVSPVHHESTFSGVPYVSSGELISGCNPPGRCQLFTISGRHG